MFQQLDFISVFLDSLLLNQVAPHLFSEGWTDPIKDLVQAEKLDPLPFVICVDDVKVTLNACKYKIA